MTQRCSLMGQDDPIARSFELARSGRYESIEDIRRQLSREGYANVSAHFQGLAIKKQMIKAARPEDAPPPRKR